MNINDLRINYSKSSINFDDLISDPKELFKVWFNEALRLKINEPNAFVLSTVSNQNTPSSRVVLLKEVNSNGFVFFTNYLSKKSKEIENNPFVSLNFYWPDLEKQIRITGKAIKISRAESEKYFSTRPTKSKIGAVISNQSEEISFDFCFNNEIEKNKEKFENFPIACPDNWGGYCVFALSYEFWQGRPSRLHDRLSYILKDDVWEIRRLSP